MKIPIRKQSRKGTATVELAVCLPMLFLIIFGGIEAANSIFLKQGLTVAAYETAKMATTVGYTVNEAIARGDEVLTSRGFNGAQVSISPNVAVLEPGTQVTVTITAPANANSISPQIAIAGNASISAQVVMIRN